MLVLLCTVPACAQENANHNHNTTAATPAASDPMVSQDWAKQGVAKAPRLRVWVKVKTGAG
jgi:hypothetical protein